jgi:hypothetical protein
VTEGGKHKGSDILPKPRPTELQRQQTAFKLALARVSVEKDLKYDMDVARTVGMSPRMYSHYKADNFDGLTVDKLRQIIKRLELTGEEVCKFLGAPL